MKHIKVVSAKGGVGATTVALSTALSLSMAGNKTLIVGGEDIKSIMALQVAPSLSYASKMPTSGTWDFVVHDLGNSKKTKAYADMTILAVANDYITCKNSLAFIQSYTAVENHAPLMVVGLYTDTNALSMTDISSVLEHDITWIERNESIQRATDAGLFVFRYKHTYIDGHFIPLHKATLAFVSDLDGQLSNA